MKANKTSFKKGNIPENYRPIGSTRYCSKDGYKYIKVADPNKWELAHRVIWEEHNGKIPKGHIVLFRDRDINNLDIDNLTLVSRAELLKLNSDGLIFEEAELTDVGINIARLKVQNDKAKRRTKDAR